MSARRRHSPPGRSVLALLVVEVLAFLFFAVLHLGIDIPLGSIVVEEPRRNYAVIVEGAAAAVLTLGALSTITHRRWAWVASVSGQAVALAGVVWGQVAIRAGRGPHTTLNDTFHVLMTAILIIGLVVLVIERRHRS